MRTQLRFSISYWSMAVPVYRGSPKTKGLLKKSSPFFNSKLLLNEKQKNRGNEVSQNPSFAPYVAIPISNEFLGVFNRGCDYRGSYCHSQMA